MGCEVEQMYFDLNSLLEDICKFLSGDKLGKLSPKDQKLAESLINRSKKQLQEIAKIQPTLQCNEDYVVMNNPDDMNSKQERPRIEEQSKSPHAELPAKHASQDVKCGIITMKKRILFGFEITKRVYASIHEGWFLIYASERDMKPLYTIDLENYEAKDSSGEKSNFELLSTIDEKKVYQFLALTHKDMLQWTVHINKKHDEIKLGRKNTEYLISDITSERNYSNINEDSCTDEDNPVYEELTTIKEPKRKLEGTKSKKPNISISLTKNPPLPPSRISSIRTKAPIKVTPPVIKTISVSTNNSSDGSLASYHEITNKPLNSDSVNESNRNSVSVDDSFSNGSGDSIYETFENIKQNIPLENFDNYSEESKNQVLSVCPTEKKTNSL